MKVLISTDSFKDCLAAKEVCENLKKGLLKVSPSFDVRTVPVGDGGEGTVEALLEANKGSLVYCKVQDPLGREIAAGYGISGDRKTAIIEMASASGIELLKKEERNPWVTSTYGTGQLIKDALDNGCRRFICGIGGSATNDGGVGMASALGIQFLNDKNEPVGMGGGELVNIRKIDLSTIDPRIVESEFIIACDVNNPLTGENGASHVYAKQKGADENMVLKLNLGLEHLAERISVEMGRQVKNIPGAGAAGGLGAGFVAFLDGKLQKGIEIVIDETQLETHCQWADFVITGEGKMDFQTKYGKTPQGVASVAQKYNVPVIAVAGTLGENYQELYTSGFEIILSIIDQPMQLEEALQKAPGLLENAGFAIGKMLRLSHIGI